MMERAKTITDLSTYEAVPFVVGDVIKPLPKFIEGEFDPNHDYGEGLALNEEMFNFLKSRTSFVVSIIDNIDDLGDFRVEDQPCERMWLARCMFEFTYPNNVDQQRLCIQQDLDANIMALDALLHGRVDNLPGGKTDSLQLTLNLENYNCTSSGEVVTRRWKDGRTMVSVYVNNDDTMIKFKQHRTKDSHWPQLKEILKRLGVDLKCK